MSRWEIFWAYIDTIKANNISGFTLFSMEHFLWLFILLILMIAYIFAYRRGTDATKDQMRKVLGLFLILYEIMKQCVMALTGAPTNGHLPIEICSFAEYMIIIDAMWPKSKMPKQLLLFEFLPAAVVALLLPTAVKYPSLNFYVLHQFIMHAGIVAYVVARYSSKEIPLKYVGVWQAALGMLFQMLPIYFIDTTFHLNYMFLTDHENNPVLKMLWNISGGTGGLPYIIALAILVLIVMHVCYMGFMLAKKLSKKAK